MQLIWLTEQVYTNQGEEVDVERMKENMRHALHVYVWTLRYSLQRIAGYDEQTHDCCNRNKTRGDFDVDADSSSRGISTDWIRVSTGLGETELREANQGGFYESIFRNGIYHKTNPNPQTGSYVPPQTRPECRLRFLLLGLCVHIVRL